MTTAQAMTAVTRPAFDAMAARSDFPILQRSMNGKPLVYLDSAASAQKPQTVIDAVSRSYETRYANVHRGVYRLAAEATADFEAARESVRRLLNARESREIVFVRGATEAINLVAQSWGQRLVAGDEIILSHLEHHSNIVPWKLLCERSGAVLRVIPVDDAGELDMAEYARLLSPRTAMVAITHVSNALGTVVPLADIIAPARAAGAAVLVDGCQAVPHMAVDVQALDPDFYVFSGHKLYGPSGIGALYGKAAVLESMPPWQGGGEMIHTVSFEQTTYADIPHRFEAGTPHIAGAAGLTAAIAYVQGLGLEAIAAHEHELLAEATRRLGARNDIRLIGTARQKAAILSFVMAGVHPHDAATILDQEGVAVRAGHHCAQPLMARFDVAATLRASFGLYNTVADIDRLEAALDRAREIFR
ncbi:MAG: cysteine desulfurase [Alphaproteobacteria bacterium]